ncbi:MAG: GNAT family N-acetyltransferase [Rhodanobacteraceae bacterium]
MSNAVRLPNYRIETERLILRTPQPEDFDSWAAFATDEEAMRHLGGVQSRPVAWRGFVAMAGAWAMQGFAMFAVIEKVSGDWIGRLGPWMPEGWPGTEVGWSLVRKVWGRGYATEGATAAIDWAFANLGWSEVIHTIAPDNAMSQAVARRLGSTRRGPGRMPPPFEEVTVEIWGQTRAQWFARNRNRESAA